jgi:hypothetical protein
MNLMILEYSEEEAIITEDGQVLSLSKNLTNIK